MDQNYRSWGVSVGVLFAFCLSFAACSKERDIGDAKGQAGSSTSPPGSIDSLSNLDSIDPEVDLEIAPADPVLEWDLAGAAPTVSFVVKANGQVVESPEWRTDRVELGKIGSEDGIYTPTGEAGGLATIRVLVGDKVATTTITLRLTATENGAEPGLPTGVGGEGNGPAIDPDDKNSLDAEPSAADAPDLLYPYDETVFPLSVLPPLLMWSEPSEDVRAIRIRLTSKYLNYTGYFGRPAALAGGQEFVRHPIPEDSWKRVTLSAAGEELDLELVLLSGGKAVGPLRRKFQVAKGRLLGTVYYNSYESTLVDQEGFGVGAAILGIAPRAKEARLVLGFDSSDNTGCRACHTVRADGSKLLANFGASVDGGSSGQRSLLFDISTLDEQVYPIATERKLSWMALHKDGKLGLGNSSAAVDLFGEGETELYDVETGEVVESTGLRDFVTQASLPSFSADGKKVVFTFTQGPGNAEIGPGLPTKLVVMDFDAETKTFSKPKLLFDHTTYAPGWASFTPTSEHVVFSVTTKSSSGRFATEKGNEAEIWIAEVASGKSWRLDRLNGLSEGASYLPKDGIFHQEDEHLNYEPTVSPIVSGGYVWLVFTSRRLYGNATGDDDPWLRHRVLSGAHPKKLWVSALDLRPESEKDGSHPAFLLPGQEQPAINARGFWVNSPCLEDGQSCEAGVDCCGGACIQSQDGSAMCGAGDGECRQENDRCSVSAECCQDPTRLECIGGVCVEEVVR